MPFKLPFSKSRQYNVISRSVLVVCVELLDSSTLECTLSADCTGQHCLENVAQRIGLGQPEYFGLRYMCKRPYPKVRWVELDRPLKKQLDKYAQSAVLSLSILYYIHDIGLLHDDTTLSHFYLQVKQDVLEGKLRCNYEQAVLLASYSLQAEYGDHQPDRHTPEYLKDFVVLPKLPSLNEAEVTVLLELAVCQYASLRGLAQTLAETYYILEAQHLEGYGQETFMARDERGSEVYLGASLVGVTIRPASGHSLTTLRWNDISNLVNLKRAFAIECPKNGRTFQFTFDEPDAAKYIWKMCVKQHTFFKRNQKLLEKNTSEGDDSAMLAVIQGRESTSTSGTSVQHQPDASTSFSVRGITMPDLQRSVISASDVQMDRDHFNYQGFAGMHQQPSGNIYKQKNYQQQPQTYIPTALNTNDHQLYDPLSRGFALRQIKPSFGSANNTTTVHLQEQPHMQQAYAPNNCHIDNVSSCHRINSSVLTHPQTNSSIVHYALPLHDDTTMDASAIRVHCLDNTSPCNNDPSNNEAYQHSEVAQRYSLVHNLPGRLECESVLPSSDGGISPLQQQVILYNSNPNLSTTATTFSNSFRKTMLPEYRPAPDYHSVMRLRHQVGSVPLSKADHPQQNTLSTPDIQSAVSMDPQGKENYRALPPPYPGMSAASAGVRMYLKSNSTSSPDLLSATSAAACSLRGSWTRLNEMQLHRANVGLTHATGMKGLSRTYENLCDLDDVVLSLRHHMTGDGNSQFLHSLSSVVPLQSVPSLDCLSDRPSVYHLSEAPAVAARNTRPMNSADEDTPEPIYQNVAALSQQQPQQYQEQLQKQQQLLEHQELLQKQFNDSGMDMTQSITVNNVTKTVQAADCTGSGVCDASRTMQSNIVDPIVQKVVQDQRFSLRQEASLPVNPLASSIDSTKSSPQVMVNSATSTENYVSSVNLRTSESLSALGCSKVEPGTTVISVNGEQWSSTVSSLIVNSGNKALSSCPEGKGITNVGNASSAVSHNPVTFDAIANVSDKAVSPCNEFTTELERNNITRRTTLLSSSSTENCNTGTSTSSTTSKDAMLLSRIYAARDPRARQLQNELLSAELPVRYKSLPLSKTNASYAIPRSEQRQQDWTVPYNENKVTIQPSQSNIDGYINASHITASMDCRRQVFYIVQSLSPDCSAADVWQCIWEQDVRLVVIMATCFGGGKIEETASSSKSSKTSKFLSSISKKRGRKKEASTERNSGSSQQREEHPLDVGSHDEFTSGRCHPYWPQIDNTSMECGQYRVYRRDSTECDGYTISRLVVKTSRSASRTVWHINYTHGLTNSRSFIEMIEQLSSLRDVSQEEASAEEATTAPGINVNTPILLQCVTGIEHCGVVMLCDLMIGGARSSTTREGTLRAGVGSGICDAVVIENSYSIMGEGAVMDPYKLLAHLRQQRANLVPTINMFKFVYRVMIDYFGRSRLI